MDKKAVIFLDRDGVINRKAAPHSYITRWEEFQFLPGVIEAIRKFGEAGFLILVVTNQRGIARKICTKEQINHLHDRMQRELESQSAQINGIYVCPHGDNECECRKPKPGLLIQAEQDLNQKGILIDKEKSWMIGDSFSDIEAGNVYGVQTILISSSDFGKPDGVKCQYVCDNLIRAAGKILSIQERKKR